MDTMSAMYRGMAARGNVMKVFDWIGAANMIKEKGIKNATAGLESDFEYTAGTILKDGKIVDDDYVYLSSTWATPLLQDDDSGEKYPCYIMDDKNPHKWDEHTKWPKEARDILEPPAPHQP